MSDYKKSLIQISNIIAANNRDIVGHIIETRRVELSGLVQKHLKNTVAHGPLTGLIMSERTHWSASDKAAMLLGLYEAEIVQLIQSLSGKYSTFIDVGAGEGYYAAGMLVGKHFAKTICYELTDTGREVIADVARLNGIGGELDIRGTADKGFYLELTDVPPEECLVLIDVEGHEFTLMDEAFFAHFSKSDIIVELHDFMVENGKAKLEQLIADASETHTYRTVTTGPRDPSKFQELRMLSDTDRWLICSEGRPRLMVWLHFQPRT